MIWGEDDPIIPVSHARVAHEQIPGSHLEIFEQSGHVPHDTHPQRFVATVEKFIDSTEPFAYQPDLMRVALQTGVSR
jgi:pimeloyl-ACP methyl ester carboxylesterase